MRTQWIAWTLGALLAVTGGTNAQVIDKSLQQTLNTIGPAEGTPVIITFEAQVDPTAIVDPSKNERRRRTVSALRDLAEKSQPPLVEFLQARGATDIKQLWIINSIAATLNAATISAVANWPGVAEIRSDGALSAPQTTLSTGPSEWNIDGIQAPKLWDLGFSGSGIVVASIDTGVDADHPDLSGKWRGGSGAWYDPHGEHPTAPFDPNGHGTQTLGLIVGGDAGGTTIGVAPSAKWIAVKLFDDSGKASYSDAHLGFQWLLDPDGDPQNDDAPDVVNASWGYDGSAGKCILEFDGDIATLKAVDIAVVFSAGNSGPWDSSSVSPANNPSGFGIGAIKDNMTVARTSSRGPSACDGTIFPEVVAPGVSVRTADLSFGGFPFYATVSGTSFAAAHASGAMALLAGAKPGATVAQLEEALTVSAVDLGNAGGDNTYGSGLIDVLEAYNRLDGTAPANPAIGIQKKPDSQQVLSGEFATFTITVTNLGDVTLSNVAVSDPIVPGCDANIGTLDVGVSLSHQCSVAVNADFTNVAMASGDAPDGTQVQANDSAQVTVVAASGSPAVDVQMTPDNQSVSVGGNDGIANFTIDVTNTGDVELLNVAVSVAGAPDCNHAIGTLAIAQGMTYTCAQTIADQLVDIVSTDYDVRRNRFSVTATSSMGRDANLEVDGLGPMTFKKQSWVLSERVNSDPRPVTVRGRAIISNTATASALAPDGTPVEKSDNATVDAIEQ